MNMISQIADSRRSAGVSPEAPPSERRRRTPAERRSFGSTNGVVPPEAVVAFHRRIAADAPSIAVGTTGF